MYLSAVFQRGTGPLASIHEADDQHHAGLGRTQAEGEIDATSARGHVEGATSKEIDRYGKDHSWFLLHVHLQGLRFEGTYYQRAPRKNRGE